MSSKIYIKNIIEELHSLLLKVLTKNSPFENENEKYQNLKRRINALKPILGPLPDFIDTSDDLWILWNKFIKGILPTYDSRRKYLKEQFKDYYDKILGETKLLSFEEELIYRDLVIQEKIGEGGYSAVYKAEHIILNEYRVIKKLDPIFAKEEDEITALRRFAREVQILSRLNHTNIVKVHDAGIAGEYPYIVMNFITGKNLCVWIDEKGVFTEEIALYIMKQILSAVSSVHDINFVHRDIKPSNVIWDGTNATILDFGVGQWLEYTITTRMTTAPIGSYGYIAPELFENPKLIDKNLDCYSLGILFHFILTGRIPVVGNPTYYLEENKIHKDIIEFILRSISTPTNRFMNGKDMLESLEKITI